MERTLYVASATRLARCIASPSQPHRMVVHVGLVVEHLLPSGAAQIEDRGAREQLIRARVTGDVTS
jgi:hypothetical protein